MSSHLLNKKIDKTVSKFIICTNYIINLKNYVKFAGRLKETVAPEVVYKFKIRIRERSRSKFSADRNIGSAVANWTYLELENSCIVQRNFVLWTFFLKMTTILNSKIVKFSYIIKFVYSKNRASKNCSNFVKIGFANLSEI